MSDDTEIWTAIDHYAAGAIGAPRRSLAIPATSAAHPKCEAEMMHQFISDASRTAAGRRPVPTKSLSLRCHAVPALACGLGVTSLTVNIAEPASVAGITYTAERGARRGVFRCAALRCTLSVLSCASR
jgi:hypothetical protein